MSKDAMAVQEVSPGYGLQAAKPTVAAGYKQTEVGVIPEDWAVVPLGALAAIVRGKFSARPRNDPRYYGGEFPFLQTGDITRSAARIRSFTQTLNEAGVGVSRLFPKGTLFFTIAANIGDVGISEFEAACPDSIVAISPQRPNIKNWLFYELSFRKQEFEALASPGAQLNINLEKLRPYLLSVPTIEEQRAIAAALSDVDALLEELDCLIAKKRDIKQATMQQLLTGQTRLPGFEGEWSIVQLGNHVTFLRNGTNSRAELLSDGSVKYLHYGDIHAANTSVLEPESLPYIPPSKVKTLDRIKDGDLVFADASEDMEGVGKSVELVNVGCTEMVSGLHTIVARFNKKVLADGFKAYLQFCPEFISALRRLAAGTKVYATTRSHIASIELKLPDVGEQKAISGIFQDMDTEIQALKQRRNKTAVLKQAMMQELLTGRTRLV